jgi:hypothetical protein
MGKYGLAAVCIWAGFIVVSRLGVRTSLTPWDVAATILGEGPSAAPTTPLRVRI